MNLEPGQKYLILGANHRRDLAKLRTFVRQVGDEYQFTDENGKGHFYTRDPGRIKPREAARSSRSPEFKVRKELSR